MDLTEKMTAGNRHPWELSRAQCLINVVNKYHIHTIADIGAGDRFFTSKLVNIVSGNVYAVDKGYSEKENNIDSICCFNDISALPDITYGGGGVLMDVIEHVENDSVFLTKILEKIPEGGFLFITVPAFQFLFSSHDVFLKHYRRYNRKQLVSLLNSLNVRIEKCHYFYASLFLMRCMALLFKKKKEAFRQSGIGKWRFSSAHIITQLIRVILNIDFHICAFLARFRLYVPGLSLLAVCEKRQRTY